MNENIELTTILKNTAEKLKKEKQEFLSKALMRGKISKEIREKINCYNDFKEWAKETGYSISTLNRDINRYEFHELMKKETGKRTIEGLSVILVLWINKLKEYDFEKFMELLGLIDNGLDKTGIKSFLEENITEESTQLSTRELRECMKNLEKEIVKVDIRKIKQNIRKKIMKAVKKVLKIISGCTKLNTANKNRELSRNIENLNYGLGVLNIS